MSAHRVALDALREAQADAPEELLRLLKVQQERAERCPECEAEVAYYDGPAYHFAQCRLAHWLRVFGGEAERQRQVDAAHEAAVAEYRPRRMSINQEGSLWFGINPVLPPLGRQNIITCAGTPDGRFALLDEMARGGFVHGDWPSQRITDVNPETRTITVASMPPLATGDIIVPAGYREPPKQRPRSRVPPNVAQQGAKRFRRGGRG